MAQEIIVYLVLTCSITYIFYGIIKIYKIKKANPCNGCSGCSLKNTSGLDPKTKQLVYIGIESSMGDTTAVYYHVMMAKNLGVTREEIRDTILITLSVCGLKGVASCLPAALEIYDETAKP
jgi:alkylhydroperoxidase/carboxymuconolactone decarboxylase family protein YurZ